ncbi:hypothetical protein CGMCC3_g9483 [Colletotrichum fructicola]|nr:uncharacterized protein CGMCC3_g9483 [Colletotrichum fructicola]KAE9574229.1 hypothetical protein CGMCC3_g9483 [Colletotrichum fructicola]
MWKEQQRERGYFGRTFLQPPRYLPVRSTSPCLSLVSLSYVTGYRSVLFHHQPRSRLLHVHFLPKTGQVRVACQRYVHTSAAATGPMPGSRLA